MEFGETPGLKKTDVLLLNEVRETEKYFIHATTIEKSCYCCEEKNKNNCDCYPKHSTLDYRGKALQEHHENGKKNGYGPCVECKGTGRKIKKSESKQAKFLCVGGPFSGRKKASFQIEDDYTSYNCTSRGGRRDANPPKVVWIWNEFLPVEVPTKKKGKNGK